VSVGGDPLVTIPVIGRGGDEADLAATLESAERQDLARREAIRIDGAPGADPAAALAGRRPRAAPRGARGRSCEIG
jgi:hypothetical protein